MGQIRVGASELGLNVQWRYAFVGPGTPLQPSRDAVLLDVGGRLEAGCLDQHQDGSLGESTCELVLSYPEHAYSHLMNPWLQRRDDGQELRERLWSPVVVTHADPDFDAMVSAWLVRKLVETGDLPAVARSLVGYATHVDQGRYRIDLAHDESVTRPVHMAYLVLQSLLHEVPGGNVQCLERGFALIDACVTAFGQSASRLSPGDWYVDLHADHPAAAWRKDDHPAAAWRKDDRFADLRSELDADREKHEQDKRHRIPEWTKIELPAAKGHGSVEVSAFFASRPPTSRLNKYWVRADGHVLYCCPYARHDSTPPDPSDLSRVYPCVIVSVDPSADCLGAGKRALFGLGATLEALERREREAHGGDTRLRVPRYKDGSVDNEDPWYDGRGHNHTIVDAPRNATRIPYLQVCAAVRERFWEIPLARATVHVVVTEKTTALRPAAAGVKMVNGCSDVLAPWFKESAAAVVTPRADLPTPPGFARTTEWLRWFPHDLADPVRIATFDLTQPHAGTLEQLVAWAQKIDEDFGSSVHLFTSVELPPGRSADPRVAALFNELCLGSTRPAGGVGHDVVLFNQRAVAVQQAVKRTPANADLLLTLLTYAVFQANALERFSLEAGQAVDSTGRRVTGGAELRSRFLEFQTRHFHTHVTRDDLARTMYAGVIEELGVERLYDKVSQALDRIDQIEKEAQQRRLDVLVFFVGLTGVVQAGTVAFGDLELVQIGLMVAALVGISVYFYRIHRGRADRTPPPSPSHLGTPR